MGGKFVVRRAGAFRWVLWTALTIVVFPASLCRAETIGNNLWNMRENPQDFFHDNVPYIRPWRGAYDDGWGMFVGPAPYGGPFPWVTSSTTGNPVDGSLSLVRGVDTQFHVWTYLYVSTPTIVPLAGDGDCVPRWFLNYAFDSPQQFPLGTPASINLAAGWNRLDITGYNQNAGFQFESGALASQVSIMNSSPVPEPSTICAIVSMLATGSAVLLIRRQVSQRRRGRYCGN